MAITFKEIEAFDNGARFFNGDLHVHSFGGSHDVKDSTMTVQALIDSALTLNISILAITDHNNDANLKPAIEYAEKFKGRFLLLAGVEITTANGHLLVYFSPDKVENANELLARINLVGKRGELDTHTTRSMADVIKEAETLGGVCLAAHIDLPKTGFEMLSEGYPNWKKDIITSSGLLGVEIKETQNLNWYSTDDDNNPRGLERRKLIDVRSKNGSTFSRVHLAHIQSSDAHTMKSFNERNFDQTITRIKMNELTFESFRTALLDPTARVRPLATIPRSIPRILGLHISGGFIDGQVINLSNNLNCLIGGRGTGKSTVLQCLAFGLGISEKLEENTNGPNAVIVYCEDSNGVIYRYERRRGARPLVKAKEDKIHDVPEDAFRVEFYSQGDLAEVAKDPLKNPILLQEFLDRHISLRDLREKEAELVSVLEENSGQLIPLEGRFEQLPANQQTLKELVKKIKIAEEGKLKEIAAIQSKLSSEKSLAQALDEYKKSYRNGMSLSNFLRNFDELKETTGEITADPKSDQILGDIKKIIEEANLFLSTKEKEINSQLKVVALNIEAKIQKLNLNHSTMEADLSEKIGELRKKGLTGSLEDFQTIVNQKTEVTRTITNINAQLPQLNQLRADRKKYLFELDETRKKISDRRKEQLQSINKHLSKTIQDYFVFVHYEPSGIIEDFKSIILEVMQGSHLSEQLANRFASSVTPKELAELIKFGNATELSKVGEIGSVWAKEMISRFRFLTTIHKLEVLWKPPCPIITVRTKSSPPKDIPVNQLSDGQKHTIFLTIAMFAETNLPLIIDQPEDDLDNAFIFSSIVTTLREIKEKRQVILITHNANIAVLGDAELLIPMRRSVDKGIVFERGSIDRAETKAEVRNILEGGDLAFRRRMEIYGY